MREGKFQAGVVRHFLAVCLAMLFTAASLAPAAITLSAASSCSCCKRSVKCCCRKPGARLPQAPSFSARSCAADCGAAVAGVPGGVGLLADCARSAGALRSHSLVQPAYRSTFAERHADDARRQRPPPAIPA